MICKKMILGLILVLMTLPTAYSSGASLYTDRASWRDDEDKDFKLEGLKGKRVLVSMGYTSCQGSCPLIVAKLKKIEARFVQKNLPIEVVLITFDPKFDTPERNTTYFRGTMGLTGKNWHFLNGSESDTRRISMLLGIKYTVNPSSGAIGHDNKVILLNQDGEIKGRLEELSEDEAALGI